MPKTDVANVRARLNALLHLDGLPLYDDFISLCNDASSVLETEDASYRPSDSSGSPGGLLDFASSSLNALPVIVVPDVHARLSLILDVLDFSPPFGEGKSVLELLFAGKLLVVLLGDLPHAESRARKRWADAYGDFCSFYYDDKDVDVFLKSKSMNEEMRENLAVWQSVFILKTAFPHFFHVLKGNHENVRNATFSKGVNLEFGNRAFRKFCEEGVMCAEFIRNKYDDLFLHCLACFEHALPVCAVLKNCILSHAEPFRHFSREELVNALTNDSAVYDLTWTANDAASEDSVSLTISSLYKRGFLGRNQKAVRWIGGHRPVSDTFALRQGGLFVQIHNPDVEQVACVFPDRTFNPQTDIFLVEKRTL